MSQTSIDVPAVLRLAAEFIAGGRARTAVGAISVAAGSAPVGDAAVTAFLSHLGLDVPPGAAARLALCDSVARGRLNSVELAARLREAADAAPAESASRKEAV
jgi:hypothetical protein